MFLVFNKQKIYSYIVAFTMVAILFGLTAGMNLTQNAPSVATASGGKELPIYSVDVKEKKLALTMNCAWNADDIDSILDTLKKHDTKITFFMVGDWVSKYPEAVEKIATAGQEIGNHSDGHKHVNQLNAEENIEQIQMASDKIEKITGKATALYRAPYGEYNNTVVRAAKTASHYMIQWNLDTLDYKGLTGEQMWERLENNLSSGSIILMHNGTAHTADSLEMLIHNIKEKGYEIVPVSKLIYKENYTIDSTGKQIQNANSQE